VRVIEPTIFLVSFIPVNMEGPRLREKSALGGKPLSAERLGWAHCLGVVAQRAWSAGIPGRDSPAAGALTALGLRDFRGCSRTGVLSYWLPASPGLLGRSLGCFDCRNRGDSCTGGDARAYIDRKVVKRGNGLDLAYLVAALGNIFWVIVSRFSISSWYNKTYSI